jgi:transmembrane sensor
MISEDHESLIIRSLTGVATREEEAQLNTWRKEDASHEKLYAEWQQIYHARVKSAIPPFDSLAEWQRLESAIANSADSPATKVMTGSRSLWLMPWSRVAAVVALLVASLFLIREMVREKTIIHESGDRLLTVKLHDGTTVTLRENSKLIHTTEFNREDRQVTLEGEGYFQVMHNPSKKFVVLANQTHVEVLGTSFLVRALNDTSTSVAVVEGTVAFSSAKERVTLTKGNGGSFNVQRNQLRVEEVSLENITAWKEHRLTFRKTSLKDVASSLEDYFQVVIEFTDPAIATCRFTGSFEEPQLEDVLDALTESLSLQVDLRNGKYFISGQGCN